MGDPDRKDPLRSRQLHLPPPRPRRRAARKTNFIRAVRSQIAPRILRRQRHPLDSLKITVDFENDLGILRDIDSPDVVGGKLMTFHGEANSRRFLIPGPELLIPCGGLSPNRDPIAARE